MIKLYQRFFLTFYFLGCLLSTVSAQYEATLKNFNFLLFNHLQEEVDISNMIASRVYEDANGFIWFSTETGLCRFDGKQKRYFKGKKNGKYRPIHASVFSRDNHGNVWLAEGNRLFRFNSLTENFENQHYSLQNNESIDQITALQICDSTLWIGSKKGVFTATLGDTIQLRPIPISKRRTPQTDTPLEITSLHVSAGKHLWVGTKGEGLYIVADYKEPNALLMPICIGKLCSMDIISVIDYDADHLLVSTSKGLSVIDSQRNSRTLLNSNRITDTNVTSTGEIWCSTYGEGLFYFEDLQTSYETYMTAFGRQRE